jgi:hypothetical protein
MKVIEAILDGERDPEVLAGLCQAQILNKKRAQVIASLEGDWQEHHLFVLRQALEAYRFYQGQMAACDLEIGKLLDTLTSGLPAQELRPGQKVKIVRHNRPQIEDLHGRLLTLAGGRDATLICGISPLGWMKLIGEVGIDLSPWANENHFAAWAALAPLRHQSGRRRRRLPRPKPIVGQIFREAVPSIAKSKHLALGGFYRRIKGRRGAAVATVATARKLALLYYRVMTHGLEYVERGLADYEAAYQKQQERHLRKLATRFGFTLQPV